MSKSNCNLWAWREFREGRTDIICLRKTSYSAWSEHAESAPWRSLIKPFGAMLGYPAWALVQIAWFLMYGRWAHVTTCRREFVPNKTKRKRYIPPILFNGKIQKVAERSWTE